MNKKDELKKFMISWLITNIILGGLGMFAIIIPGFNLIAVPAMCVLFVIINIIFIIISFVKFFSTITSMI